MQKYELEYKQPYEMDYDSGPGIGDHVIEHTNLRNKFQAENDKQAKAMVSSFLNRGSIVFNHHIDGNGKTYNRKLIRLIKIIKEVE